jgi:hypothetical protein
VFDGSTGALVGRVGTADENQLTGAKNAELHGVACSDDGDAAPPTKLPNETK